LSFAWLLTEEDLPLVFAGGAGGFEGAEGDVAFVVLAGETDFGRFVAVVGEFFRSTASRLLSGEPPPVMTIFWRSVTMESDGARSMRVVSAG